MMRHLQALLGGTRALALLGAVMLACLGATHTRAQAIAPPCAAADVTSFTATSLDIPSYDPFNGNLTFRNFTVSVTTNKACYLFHRLGYANTSASKMSNGTATTPRYRVTTPGGGSGDQIIDFPINDYGRSILTSANVPTTYNQALTLDALTLTPAGTYTDPSFTITLHRSSLYGNNDGVIKTLSAPVSATVIKTCAIDTASPSAGTLAFPSSSLAAGLPNPATVKAYSTLVSCSFPTRVQLIGKVLLPTSPANAQPGFDNFINYRAVGTFGAASAAMTTSFVQNASPTVAVDSGGTNIASGTTLSGTLGVDVNLVRGNQVLAGTYTGVLVVRLDPTL